MVVPAGVAVETPVVDAVGLHLEPGIDGVEPLGLLLGGQGHHAGRVEALHVVETLVHVLLGRVVDEQSLPAAPAEIEVVVADLGGGVALHAVTLRVVGIEPAGHAVGTVPGVVTPVGLEVHVVELVAEDISITKATVPIPMKSSTCSNT